jgi:hypothetical protein
MTSWMNVSELIKVLNNVMESEGDIEILIENSGSRSFVDCIYSYTAKSVYNSDAYKVCVIGGEGIPEIAEKTFFKEKY